jgi:hypothetical protein
MVAKIPINLRSQEMDKGVSCACAAADRAGLGPGVAWRAGCGGGGGGGGVVVLIFSTPGTWYTRTEPFQSHSPAASESISIS